MGTIICKVCDETVEHFEDEKVTTLYGKCDHCNDQTAIKNR